MRIAGTKISGFFGDGIAGLRKVSVSERHDGHSGLGERARTFMARLCRTQPSASTRKGEPTIMTGTSAAKKNRAASVGDIKELLVIAAMEVEENAILQGKNAETITINEALGIKARRIQLPSGKHITTLRTGVGLVNSALGFGFVSQAINLDAVILLGVGGSLSTAANIGDVVIARRVLQHDSVFTGTEGNIFMPPGKLFLTSDPKANRDPFLNVEPFMIEWLANEAVIESYRRSGHGVYQGTILSGSEFVARIDRKQELSNAADDAMLVEMEAAAVAQVAEKLNLPFAVVKTVADRVSPEGTIAQDYTKFLRAAAENSQHLFEHIVRSLG